MNYKEMSKLNANAYEAGCIETLKRVFRYGYGMETHMNILDFLNEKGILPEEYKKWGHH